MNETQNCYNVYALRFNLEETQRNFLLAYTITVNGVITFTLNALLILVLVKTKQTNTPALKVLLYLSMLDVGVSLTVPTVFTVLLSKFANVRNCTTELLLHFISVFFGHMSGGLGGIIAYDRYARVRYLMEYRLVMSERKINRLILAEAGFSLFSVLSYAFGALYGVYEIASSALFTLDCVVMLLICVIYILTRLTIRKHRKSANPTIADRMKEVDETIMLLSKMVLLSMLFCYGSFVLANTSSFYLYGYTKTRRGKSWFEFFVILGEMMLFTNSAMNAVVFFVINKKAHVFLRKLFSRKERIQTIAPVIKAEG